MLLLLFMSNVWSYVSTYVYRGVLRGLPAMWFKTPCTADGSCSASTKACEFVGGSVFDRHVEKTRLRIPYWYWGMLVESLMNSQGCSLDDYFPSIVTRNVQTSSNKMQNIDRTLASKDLNNGVVYRVGNRTAARRKGQPPPRAPPPRKCAPASGAADRARSQQ